MIYRKKKRGLQMLTLRGKIVFFGSLLLIVFAALAAKAERVIELTEDNTVTLRGEVNDDSVKAVSKQLAHLVEKRNKFSVKCLIKKCQVAPIYLVLDSPGGNIQSGQDLIELIKPYKNVQTLTLFAASMAAGIQQAVAGPRLGTANSMTMFHRARGHFSGYFDNGEVESQLELAHNMVDSMEKINADRIGMPIEAYKAKAITEWWIYGEKAVALNVLDEIVQGECSPSLTNETESASLQTFMGSINLTYSKCPLIRGATISSDQQGLFNKLLESLDNLHKLFFNKAL